MTRVLEHQELLDLFEQPNGIVIVCKHFDRSIGQPIAPKRPVNVGRTSVKPVPASSRRNRRGVVIKSR